MTTDSTVPSRIPALLAVVVVTAVLWGTTGTAATFAEGLAGIVAQLVGLGGDMDPVLLAITALVASVIANVAIALSPATPSDGHRRREVSTDNDN